MCRMSKGMLGECVCVCGKSGSVSVSVLTRVHVYRGGHCQGDAGASMHDHTQLQVQQAENSENQTCKSVATPEQNIFIIFLSKIGRFF